MLSYDVTVIGGGAAGLMAAIHAAHRGLKVMVIDKNRQLAKKLRITGKGRCNLTNNCEIQEFMSQIRSNSRFLYSSISAFTPQQIMEFFEGLNLKLVTERGNRVFPAKGNAHDVAEALITAAKQKGVNFKKGIVTDIKLTDGKLKTIEIDNEREIVTRAVVIATGGLSYPKTGSTGEGYVLAERLGHTITPTRPSLVPLICNGDEAKLQGLSLRNVELLAEKDNEIIYRQLGEMLFTHFGLSGPLVLSLSACLVDIPDLTTIEMYVDLKP
ncbi:MAG: NAD(P)/FAD-dependent oxidoreductase, partial [Oscillospiraceae bacterium]|nr:NAD(P)/FAD-dependent oxidoreductase [Oscillospiraceae bacterium]